jgi:hypothetical protein
VVAALWGPFALVAIALCAVRWRRSWLWIAFAVIELAVHSLIPHKEYRFVYPALAALIVAAALGSADLVVRIGPRIRGVRPAWLTAAVAGAWLLTSLALAASPQFRPEWTYSRAELQSEFWLAGRADLCGVLFSDSAWTETGGYAFLHRRAPLYFPAYAMTLGPGNQLLWPADMDARRRRLIGSEGAFNYVVAASSSLSQFEPRDRPSRCFGGGKAVCVAERPGGCSLDPKLVPILAVQRLGEPIR